MATELFDELEAQADRETRTIENLVLHVCTQYLREKKAAIPKVHLS
jgi:hypothetical protein